MHPLCPFFPAHRPIHIMFTKYLGTYPFAYPEHHYPISSLTEQYEYSCLEWTNRPENNPCPLLPVSLRPFLSAPTLIIIEHARLYRPINNPQTVQSTHQLLSGLELPPRPGEEISQHSNRDQQRQAHAESEPDHLARAVPAPSPTAARRDGAEPDGRRVGTPDAVQGRRLRVLDKCDVDALCIGANSRT